MKRRVAAKSYLEEPKLCFLVDMTQAFIQSHNENPGADLTSTSSPTGQKWEY